MRVALIHDYLNQYGGAERVLEAFCELFPDAPIYTLFYDKDKTFGRFEGKTIITSFLNSKIVNNKHRHFIPLMPIAASIMKLENDYDLVLSSSAGFGKGIRCEKKSAHISYCHTPLRYAWENHKYFNWNVFLKIISAPAFWYLRRWDRRAGKKPHLLIANSNYISGKINNYYQRKAEVVYPPVDTDKFCIENCIPKKIKVIENLLVKQRSLVLHNYLKNLLAKHRKSDYFLATGRLIHYKKFDLIIKAFNKLNSPLLIIGSGPELEKLKILTRSSKINFLESVTDEELCCLYNGAQALIFPQVEDFGLVAAEAQACGTPVIALNQGGAKEIVEDGQTGVLFNNQTIDNLITAIKRFQLKTFDSKKIRALAMRFSKNKFKKNIQKIIKRELSVKC